MRASYELRRYGQVLKQTKRSSVHELKPLTKFLRGTRIAQFKKRAPPA